jgi:hypothetical protein
MFTYRLTVTVESDDPKRPVGRRGDLVELIKQGAETSTVRHLLTKAVFEVPNTGMVKEEVTDWI